MKSKVRTLISFALLTLLGFPLFIPSTAAVPITLLGVPLYFTTPTPTIKRELVDENAAGSLSSRQYSIPEPPPDPSPTPGDGSASGTFCTATPGPLDYVTQYGCQILVNGGNLLNLKNAASHLQYYLAGSGVDFNVEFEALINDLPNFAVAASTLVQSSATKAYNKAVKAGPGSSITFQEPSGGWKTYTEDKGNLNADWFFAEGAFSYSVSGVVTLKGPSTSNATLAYVVDIFDRYNWDAGKTFTIGPITIPTIDIGHLNQVCLAQVYNVRGSTTLNVINPYDPSLPLPPITK
jgi:hypothetical protein